jgi:hypothetical protein
MMTFVLTHCMAGLTPTIPDPQTGATRQARGDGEPPDKVAEGRLGQWQTSSVLRRGATC